jgi:hypothetical protein
VLNYLKFSNVNVSVNLNPFFWKLKAFYEGPTEMDPKCHFFCVHFLAIRIVLVIDDGSY